MNRASSLLFALLALLWQDNAPASVKPLKVYILAGQSNMLGSGSIAPATTPGTLGCTVANDPDKTYGFLVDDRGKWIVREDVWIRDQKKKHSGLTAGFGHSPDHIGPELGFGHYVGERLESPVLIVKAAWGGKSLGSDFRPPSSGGKTGHYYKEVLRLVKEATMDLKTYVPGYQGQGYEIAGFAWHQGWNDRINPEFTAEYASNMANFIRDMRQDLGVPDLPFVIATTGMDGEKGYTDLERAQLSLADPEVFPEFEGNVSVIDTRAGGYDGMDFWHDADRSPSADGTHWNRNARAYLHLGFAMGDAMLLLAPGRCPFRLRAKGGDGLVTLTWKNGTERPTSVRILRDGVEIASAAPADSAFFIDRNVHPGVYEYQVDFTMPGAACRPLTRIFDGGITGLACSTTTRGLELTWQNRMVYSAIRVACDGKVLEEALPGKATSYTDTTPPSKGVVSYTVAPAKSRDAQSKLRLNLNLRGELGILDLIARGGINPTTCEPWKKGDQYHLAFVSSEPTTATSQDLSTYDAFLNKLARSAGIGGSWQVIGSSWTVDARRHTSTYPEEDGEGVPIFLLDGVTIVANNYKDLWDGSLDAPINRDERGNPSLSGTVFTGSDPKGMKDGPLGGSGEETARVTIGNCEKRERSTYWIRVYGARATEYLPIYALSERLTVADGSDASPPVLKSITDDRQGQSIPATKSVSYSVTFSEPMKASTVDTADFENASTTAVRIESVARTADPTVFVVRATPREAGSLQLRIARGADLRDLVGNALDSRAAKSDETVIGVSAAPQLEGELGILDVTAHGGVNPGTGQPWKAGDRYRLVFVTSAGTQAVSDNLDAYDGFLKRLVGAAGIGGSWRVLGSSPTVDARDHTSTNPDQDGPGEPVLLIDGVTNVAKDYKDLWDGSIQAPINRDEQGNTILVGRVFTGSIAAGVKSGDLALGGSNEPRRAVTIGDCGETEGRWIVVYNATASSSLPLYALSDPLTVKRARSAEQ